MLHRRHELLRVRPVPAEFTHEFRTEADVAEKRSKNWLWPTVIFAVGSLGLSIWLMLRIW